MRFLLAERWIRSRKNGQFFTVIIVRTRTQGEIDDVRRILLLKSNSNLRDELGRVTDFHRPVCRPGDCGSPHPAADSPVARVVHQFHVIRAPYVPMQISISCSVTMPG